MKIIYIAGKYRGKSEWEVKQNIYHAEQAAMRLWQHGFAVICPHLNTAFFGGGCEDSVWLEGDLEILKRCDAIYMLNGWQKSIGATKEHDLAYDWGKDRYYEDLNKFGERND
jgi:hypothetical protein